MIDVGETVMSTVTTQHSFFFFITATTSKTTLRERKPGAVRSGVK